MSWLCYAGHEHESMEAAVACAVQAATNRSLVLRAGILLLPTYKPDQEAWDEAMNERNWRN